MITTSNIKPHQTEYANLIERKYNVRLFIEEIIHPFTNTTKYAVTVLTHTHYTLFREVHTTLYEALDQTTDELERLTN